MTEYKWTACENCEGRGVVSVPDNGTNWGEETCDGCNGEGGQMEDEFGNTPEENSGL